MKNRLGFWLDHAAHFAAVILSMTAAFLLRFDFSMPQGTASVLGEAIWIALLVKLPVFDVAGFHRGLRQFASIQECDEAAHGVRSRVPLRLCMAFGVARRPFMDGASVAAVRSCHLDWAGDAKVGLGDRWPAVLRRHCARPVLRPDSQRSNSAGTLGAKTQGSFDLRRGGRGHRAVARNPFHPVHWIRGQGFSGRRSNQAGRPDHGRSGAGNRSRGPIGRRSPEPAQA